MSQFAPKRIFNVDSSLPLCDDVMYPIHRPINGESCIIANGGIPGTPPSTPITIQVESEEVDPNHPDSPGFYRTHSYDEVLFDIRKVQPEKIAAQLTLVDLQLFKAVKMQEFSNCNWTKKDKLQLSPNIVAFTRRFNHTSFWVVREILNQKTPRTRADILTQFIKIAKKLLDLNSLHSLKAVVSALQSTPIYRLSQTWKNVSKKDRQTFDKLEEFLSDDNNRKNLRDHMDAAKLPCIPHLGMYLTDLTYLHTVSSARGGTTSRGISAQTETIINMIAYCQNSSYLLTPEPHIQKYLTHTRYIDELQKFFEDDNYKLSLQYEPDDVTLRQCKRLSGSAQLRSSKSHEDLLTPFTSNSMDSLSQSTMGSHSDSKIWTPQPKHRGLVTRQHNTKNTRHSSTSGNFECNGVIASGFQLRVDDKPPSSGPKISTLPNSFRGSSFSGASPPVLTQRRMSESESNGRLLPFSLESPLQLQAPAKEKKPAPSPALPWRRHKKSHSLGTNVLTVLGVTKHSHSPSSSRGNSPELQQMYLIDDSVLDETFTSYGLGTPTGSLGNVSSSTSSDSEREGKDFFKRLDDVDELSVDKMEVATPIKEGVLKRKVLKRNGKSLSLRRRVQCWVQLTPNSLILHAFKPKRKSSKVQKVKGMMLKDCRVMYRDGSGDKQFVIMDNYGNHTKFIAKTTSIAQEWVESIREGITQEQERERREAERSLIKL